VYATPARLKADWGGRIPDAMIAALSAACGVTGAAARPLAARLKPQIDIPWVAALDMFENVDMPRWVTAVRTHLPNTQLLSPDCLGALVSLAYNRGPSFGNAGERYREMRAIKAHMAANSFEKIPAEFRAMRRLWPALKGLRDRREREAALFEDGLSTTVILGRAHASRACPTCDL